MSEDDKAVVVESVEVQPGVWAPTGKWVAAEDLPPDIWPAATKPKEG